MQESDTVLPASIPSIGLSTVPAASGFVSILSLPSSVVTAWCLLLFRCRNPQFDQARPAKACTAYRAFRQPHRACCSRHIHLF